MVEKKDDIYDDKEDDIYDSEQAANQREDDEISTAEEGFMEGYDSPNMIKCKKCKKCGKDIQALDLEKCHETVVDGETVWVCDTCSEEESE